MRVHCTDSFLGKTYSSFPIHYNTGVEISEKIEKEKWSEYSYYHKIVYVTDPFFSRTELNIKFSRPDFLSLKLELPHLTLISRNLPEQLATLSKNQQIPLAEKVVKATEFINRTYGNEVGWMWKTKKVDWDLTHLPFFLHLWSKPHLVEQAMVFGLARAHYLHSSIDLGPQGLEALQAACKRLDYLKLVSAVVGIATFFFLPLRPAFLHRNGHEFDNKKKIKLLDEKNEKKLDSEALKLTSNPKAALHYLSAIQADFDARTSSKWSFPFFSKSKPTSTDRISDLELIIKNEKKTCGQKLKKCILAPILFFLKVIRLFFKKFTELLTFPFHRLKSRF